MKINSKKKLFRIAKKIILFSIVCFVVSAFVDKLIRIDDYNRQISTLNQQIEEEQEVSKELQDERLNLHSDENYKKIARKTLGLVDPGDKVYINRNDK